MKYTFVSWSNIDDFLSRVLLKKNVPSRGQRHMTILNVTLPLMFFEEKNIYYYDLIDFKEDI